MSTKVFGNVTSGNHIEVRTKMSVIAKRNYHNATRSAMSMGDGEMGFKMISADLDSDIVLLRGALLSVTNDSKTTLKQNITLQFLDDSIDNADNFEDAIEFLKKENRLGTYANLENLSKEELMKRKNNLEESIQSIDKILEEPGN
jgi:hypothetical protein